MNSNSFVEAKKLITSPDAHQKFLNGKTINLILDFICALQKSVESKSKKDTPFPDNQAIKGLNNVLVDLQQLINDTPPFDEPQRYGNKAFKLWHEKLQSNYKDLIVKVIDLDKHPGLNVELRHYFIESFGSSSRIDYGTGHELNFLCVLFILYQTGYYDEKQFDSVVHHLFFPYILLVRNLQVVYKLEPAGAHGVWGLDEYHFLPFIFGASELIKHEEILPSSIHDYAIMKTYSKEYMYLNCIEYIKQVKTGGHFGEYSPTLDSISNVPNWEKVSKGLVKMYIDEVFKKIVVMQHFYFGSVIKFE